MEKIDGIVRKSAIRATTRLEIEKEKLEEIFILISKKLLHTSSQNEENHSASITSPVQYDNGTTMCTMGRKSYSTKP